jgi:hypothetical protein
MSKNNIPFRLGKYRKANLTGRLIHTAPCFLVPISHAPPETAAFYYQLSFWLPPIRETAEKRIFRNRT